jgi:hypothetical protein
MDDPEQYLSTFSRFSTEYVRTAQPTVAKLLEFSFPVVVISVSMPFPVMAWMQITLQWLAGNVTGRKAP